MIAPVVAGAVGDTVKLACVVLIHVPFATTLIAPEVVLVRERIVFANSHALWPVYVTLALFGLYTNTIHGETPFACTHIPRRSHLYTTRPHRTSPKKSRD